MDEQFDNGLNNRIREVFDNFDDASYPTADEGWLLLMEKFPVVQKKRPAAWLWRASAAAALLLFVGVGVWLTGKKQQPETMAVKPAKHPQEQIATTDTGKLLAAKQAPAVKDNSAGTASASANGSNNISNTSKTQANQLAAATPDIKNNKLPAPSNTNNAPIQQPVNTVLITKIKTDSIKAINHAAINPQQYTVTTPVATGSNTVVQQVKTKPDSVKTINAKTNKQQYAVTPTTSDSNKGVAAASGIMAQQPVKGPKQEPTSSMSRLFANENNQPQKTKEPYSEDKKVRFGVYAATFFNYAKGSNNQINAGAGFTSDIKLSKNLKLSTGVALAQNTLSYNGGLPVNANVAAAAKAPQALTYDKNLFAVNAAFPVLKNYNANLIGLDIPMNIKYEFNPQRNDTYISAGLSSGTFINEAYTSVYGFSPSSVAAGASSQTTDDVSRKNFSGFYFAKTLNVSFGVGYPVGKGNRLIIEPFLKYPLAGLGTQQIQFGAAGLNLKLNFTSPKK